MLTWLSTLLTPTPSPTLTPTSPSSAADEEFTHIHHVDEDWVVLSTAVPWSSASSSNTSPFMQPRTGEVPGVPNLDVEEVGKRLPRARIAMDGSTSEGMGSPLSQVHSSLSEALSSPSTSPPQTQQVQLPASQQSTTVTHSASTSNSKALIPRHNQRYAHSLLLSMHNREISQRKARKQGQSPAQRAVGVPDRRDGWKKRRKGALM